MKLTIPVQSYQFKNIEEKSLRDMLNDIDKITTVIPILSPADFFIKPDTCKTANGYSYSDNAFVQLCSMLSTGLSQALYDVSGHYRKVGEDRRAYSMDLAIDTFNRILKLKFDSKLAGLQIIRNVKEKTIDGLMGARYIYMPNSDFLNLVNSTV